ncbi:MAG: hypothetical protein JW751_18820 [Polyangiaceae bacterium]|nr:hypothetical protein [Polyangiaceae bacterium]
MGGRGCSRRCLLLLSVSVGVVAGCGGRASEDHSRGGAGDSNLARCPAGSASVEFGEVFNQY